jgi:type II secretory pathway pseudopilin PulG
VARRASHRAGPSRAGGYAYLFLLFTLALLSIAALSIAQLDRLATRRAEEAELRRIGGEFSRALAGYRDAAEPHRYPASLDELVTDRRGGVLRRHLRRIYVDPVTRTPEWGLVLEGGQIVGVHSLSERKPLKVAGFAAGEAGFENAQRYADWVFQPAMPTAPAAPLR